MLHPFSQRTIVLDQRMINQSLSAFRDKSKKMWIKRQSAAFEINRDIACTVKITPD